MSPPPPGSRASTIWGNLSHSTRIACACTVKALGMLTGDPMTKGTEPSQTPSAFSTQAMVLKAPPLPPNT